MGGQVTFAEELKFFSDAWREKARRDDLFNEMVPSDFRIAIQYITEASETIAALEARCERYREALKGLLGAPVSWRSLSGPLPLPTPNAVKKARAALSEEADRDG